MLARYPGLTVVGTVAIAVAIALGTLYFEAVNKWQNPRLPIRGCRPRGLDSQLGRERVAAPKARSLHDFAIWREQVKTVEHLGAAVVVRAQPRHRGRTRGAGARSGDHGQRVPAAWGRHRCWVAR